MTYHGRDPAPCDDAKLVVLGPHQGLVRSGQLRPFLFLLRLESPDLLRTCVAIVLLVECDSALVCRDHTSTDSGSCDKKCLERQRQAPKRRPPLVEQVCSGECSGETHACTLCASHHGRIVLPGPSKCQTLLCIETNRGLDSLLSPFGIPVLGVSSDSRHAILMSMFQVAAIVHHLGFFPLPIFDKPTAST